MENYKKHISYLAKNKISQIFSNSGEEHALEVFSQIFSESKEVICIFAESLCSHVPQNPQYIQLLSEFVEKGGKLEIILNNFNIEKTLESSVIKRLAYFISEGNENIELYQTDVTAYAGKQEMHFTVADNHIYRMEIDIEKRVANCNFNDEDVAGKLMDLFNKIKEDASTKPIDLLDLFQISTKS